MTVQKDNREDTLINQEGRYWLEAIKSGARGIYDLTNYVEYIRIEPTNNANLTFRLVEVENNVDPYLKPHEIIGMLSVPKYEGPTNNMVTNRITARVRAITGPATDKSPFATNTVPNTFRYQLQTEITKVRPLPPELVEAQFEADPTNGLPTRVFNESMGANLWDVRLILRWPVVERGDDWFVGNNRKVFRAQVGAPLHSMTNFNKTFIDGRDQLYLFSHTDGFNVANLSPLP